MRQFLFIVAILLLAQPAWATLAFDASSEGTGTTTLSWTHTPVGTPKGVFVFCVADTSATDVFSGATYGAVSMTQMANASDTAGEPGFTEGYFLGSSIPTGAQTVECTISSGSTAKHGTAVTVTAGTDTQAAGVGSCSLSEDATDPSCTVTGISGASYGAAGLFSGHDVGGSIVAGSGETERQGNDFGTSYSKTESSTSEQSSGDQVLNWTAALQDCALVGIAIEEVAGAGGATVSGGAELSGGAKLQ